MAAEAMKRDLGGCPDLETIAAYLDCRLVDLQRSAVTEHLSSCETCYFVFSEAAQIKQPTVAPFWKRKQVIWPKAAAALAAARARSFWCRLYPGSGTGNSVGSTSRADKVELNGHKNIEGR